MKPNANLAPARWLSRYDRPARADDSFPRDFFEFQPRRFDGSFGGSDSPWPRPGLSRLAREVLLADASRSFRIETAVLGFVSLVCAWPIVVMIREVIRLLK